MECTRIIISQPPVGLFESNEKDVKEEARSVKLVYNWSQYSVQYFQAGDRDELATRRLVDVI